MEGVAFDHARSNNFGPMPPLSAIDRFLLVQNRCHFGYENGVGSNIYPHGGPIRVNTTSLYEEGSVSELVWGCQQTLDASLVNGSMGTENFDVHAKRGQDLDKTSLKKKKVKGGYPSHLIKGQWTEEEDRNLIRLVKQFGVKKWAQVAEKMYGRAGKQCRERWQNHLRPDIKKDTWNEEEEKLLIEAHQTVGNKWAEIAKRIPGRSENSIKNHWNATKRRQNSRRKSKKTDAKNGKSSAQPSLLQNYIKSKILEETNTLNLNTITSSNTTPTNSSTSDDSSVKFDVLFPQSPVEDSTNSLISPTYDDELKFMQHLFATNTTAPPFVEDGKLIMAKNIVPKEVAPDQNMRPDRYLAFLLDGGTNCFPQSGYNNDFDVMEYEQIDQALSYGGMKNDVDLIEMVSNSTFAKGI